jgi:hypothetical protein
MTAVTFVAMLPINMIGMFMMLTHLTKKFNPNQISAALRHRRRLRGAFK